MLFISKKLDLLLFFSLTFFATIKLVSNPDPLSKITITSNKATCQKDKDIPKQFTFTYHENVLVTFADGSKINSDELEVVLDTTKNKNLTDLKTTQTPEKNNLSQFKKITFKNNVHLKSTNRSVDADKAELYLGQKGCKLFGNVKIKQTKDNPKDLPILTECNQATLNMQTEQITFLGDNQKPVCTIIEIAGHPGLMKKIKTKEQKKAERATKSKRVR